MTKETKIGLLVGLAFIILFAIILSEKGPVHKGGSAPVFSVVDATRAAPASPKPSQPLREAGRLPVDSLGPIVSNAGKPLPAAPMKEEQVARAPVKEDPLEPLPDTLAALVKRQPHQFETPKALPNHETPARQAEIPTESAQDPVHGDELKIETISAVETEPKAKLPEKHDKISEAVARAPEEGGRHKAGLSAASAKIDKPQPALPIKTEHLVQPGENLGKIAAKYYGRSTPARVDAIFNSNRDTLTSVSSVRSGYKLKIPDLGDSILGDKFEPAPTLALTQITTAIQKRPADGQVRIPIPLTDPAPNESQRETAGPNPDRKLAIDKPGKAEKKAITMAAAKTDSTLYEVRKGDTLSKIARRELGSDKFAREISKLNKDKINDKNSLKPGTKIRLPSKAVLGGETTAAISSRDLDNDEP